VTTTATDRLSLRRTALKRRFRRPPRPVSPFWLALAVATMTFAVIRHGIIEPDPAGIVVGSLCAGMYWRWAWRGDPIDYLRGRPGVQPPRWFDFAFMGACVLVTVMWLVHELVSAVAG
jgi:hypothetical protein